MLSPVWVSLWAGHLPQAATIADDRPFRDTETRERRPGRGRCGTPPLPRPLRETGDVFVAAEDGGSPREVPRLRRLQVQMVVYHSSPFGGAWRRNASNKESQTGQVGWDESGSG